MPSGTALGVSRLSEDDGAALVSTPPQELAEVGAGVEGRDDSIVPFLPVVSIPVDSFQFNYTDSSRDVATRSGAPPFGLAFYKWFGRPLQRSFSGKGAELVYHRVHRVCMPGGGD